MSPRSLAAVFAVALLLVGAPPAAALGAVAPDRNTHANERSATAVAPHNSSLGPGDVELRVELDADGDARWRVTTAVSVTDGDERAAFADLVERFNESESPLGLESFRASAANVSRATGREMAIRNVRRHHALHNETGALRVTFTWTSFGRTVGDRLRADDGFNTTSGVWLPSLSAEETLVVVPPPGYGVSSAPTGSQSAPTSLTNGVARWEGPQSFDERGPWIVYSGETQTSSTVGTAMVTPTGTADGPTTSASGPPGGSGDGPFGGGIPLVVVAVLVAAVVGGLVAYTRSDDGHGGAPGDSDGGSGGVTSADGASERDTAGAGPTAGSDDDGAVAGDGDGASGASAATAVAGGAAADADGGDADPEEADDDGIDEELLSDEERVERLIEQNGGRMKQAAIVQETGWSNAKVSQLLSSMDEQERIDKLRIGRENLISFPDEDVADLDSG